MANIEKIEQPRVLTISDPEFLHRKAVLFAAKIILKVYQNL